MVKLWRGTLRTIGAKSRIVRVALCTTPALRTRWVKFDLKRVFTFGTLHQWCVKFLSRIFYPFWPPYGWKFWFGTFDQDATSCIFDHGATKSFVRYFWSWCEYILISESWQVVRIYPYLRTLTSGATNGGLNICHHLTFCTFIACSSPYATYNF